LLLIALAYGLSETKHDPRELPVRRRKIPDQWDANSSAQLPLLNVSESPRGGIPKSRKRECVGVRVDSRRASCDLLRILAGQPSGILPHLRFADRLKVCRHSYYGVALGTLDDDPSVRPELHVHVESKAAWFTITDDLPQFPVGPKQ
jgi:hypothetical protein